MNRTEVESGVLALADVGTVLLMMDRSLIGREAEPEHMERAFYILKSLFDQRYSALRMACFGGAANA